MNRTAKLFVTAPRVVEATYVTSAVAVENLAKFQQIVAGVKKVAPRSDEFIYFVCRAIHSMEAANLDPKTGELVGDGAIDLDSGVWKSASGRLPYINQNGDAFPEAELLKVIGKKDGRDIQAYHSFIGRGLFVNHASDDAEKIRGIILDATWDPKTKGVDLLVACDKIAYPELARQIEAGYSNDVSMGTQVQWSVCSECHNKARVEKDYCVHVKTAKGGFYNGRPVYEANFGLNFIEISVVATGADPKAKIRQVIASLTKLADSRSANLKTHTAKSDLTAAQADLDKIKTALHALASADSYDDPKLISLGIDLSDDPQNVTTPSAQDVQASLLSLTAKMADLQNQIFEIKGATMSTQNKEIKAYLTDEGQGELNTTEQNKPEFHQNYTKVRDTQDKQMVGKGMEGGKDGMHPGAGSESDEAIKTRLLRTQLDERKQKREALLREAYLMDQGQGELNTTEQNKPEFHQNYTKVRDTQDKQMIGKGMEGGKDGMHPGAGSESDEAIKTRLQRASLRAKLVKAANKADSKWVVATKDGIELLAASASDFYGDDLNKPYEDNSAITNADWVHSKEFGLNLMAAIRKLGLPEVKAQIMSVKASCAMKEDLSKVADDKDAAKAKEADKKDDKKEDDKKADAASTAKTVKAGELPAFIQDKIDAKKEGGDKKDEKKADDKKDAGDKKADDKKDDKGDKDEKKAAAVADKKTVKAQMAPGADVDLSTPAGAAPVDAAKAPAPEGEEKGDVDVNINVEPDGEDKEAGSGIPADAKQALQDVASQMADLGDQLAAIVGNESGEGGLDEEASKEGEEVGSDHVDSGDELAELDQALGSAGAKGDEAKAAGDEAGMAAAANLKKQINKLISSAVKDAKIVIANTKKFVTKHAHLLPKSIRANLAARKAARLALADKLYGLTNDGMMEKDAHPKGNTTAVPGHEVKTQTAQHDANEKVAMKSPTGKLTASQEARRLKVQAFHQKATQVVAPGVTVNQTGPDGKPVATPSPATPQATAAAQPAKTATLPAKPGVVPAVATAAADKETKAYYNELFDLDPACKAFAKDLTKDYDSKSSKASIDAFKGKVHRAYRTALRQAKLSQIAATQDAVETQVNLLLEMDDKAFESFDKAVANSSKGTVVQADTKEATASGVLRTASANTVEQGEKVDTDPRHQVMAKERSQRVTELQTQLSSLNWSTTGHR